MLFRSAGPLGPRFSPAESIVDPLCRGTMGRESRLLATDPTEDVAMALERERQRKREREERKRVIDRW